MTDRILEIIKVNGLTAARFAEIIGVPRSSISHLVSGRNKPSLEFLQKVLKGFPDINPEWLYSGKGAMMTEKEENPAVVRESGIISGEDPENLAEKEVRKEAGKPRKKRESPDNVKAIEKIVVFYTDQSFREYLPE
ncbi:MAG TPA: helix-turn-helix transcriptional regulator [Bacteroidales bacterium]|nr:helix-turn-helix transcriptional regulator [Bacteroidales bacterium]